MTARPHEPHYACFCCKLTPGLGFVLPDNPTRLVILPTFFISNPGRTAGSCPCSVKTLDLSLSLLLSLLSPVSSFAYQRKKGTQSPGGWVFIVQGLSEHAQSTTSSRDGQANRHLGHSHIGPARQHTTPEGAAMGLSSLQTGQGHGHGTDVSFCFSFSLYKKSFRTMTHRLRCSFFPSLLPLPLGGLAPRHTHFCVSVRQFSSGPPLSPSL